MCYINFPTWPAGKMKTFKRFLLLSGALAYPQTQYRHTFLVPAHSDGHSEVILGKQTDTYVGGACKYNERKSTLRIPASEIQVTDYPDSDKRYFYWRAPHVSYDLHCEFDFLRK